MGDFGRETHCETGLLEDGDVVLTKCPYPSPLGTLYLWFFNGDLCALDLPGSDSTSWVHNKVSHFPAEERPLERRYQASLDGYFRFRHPMDWPGAVLLRGTPFQNRVWSALMTVPFGHVVTYKELGQEIGSRAYQAVGQALGANPIPLVVPCHRVIATSGLGGFSGGLNIKRFLLEWERSLCQVPGHA